ncbi:MAG TPA: hypothetical protein VIS07_15140 [Candidatus Binatia bacterium]
MTRLRSRRIVIVPRLLGALLALALVGVAEASTELVKNGLLSQGRDGKPDHWRNESYAPTASKFSWTVDETGVGTLRIDSEHPNDARWVQNVPVSPLTWYHVTGWIRAENVGTQTMGAYLSIMDTFHNSRDLRGTTGWQMVELWVKTGSLETSLPLACRLGGYSSLNTGTAECTGISVVAAGTPREGAPFVYGGTPGKESTGASLPLAQGVAVLVAIGILLVLWRYLAPPTWRIPP